MIAACDAYAKRAAVADPELPAIELIAARQQASYGWFDLAIPRYEEILREHRDSEAAGLAVAPLLDALRRQGRGADMRRWVDSLRADTKFLAAHPDLRELLESLHAL
jgi:lipopolysaccharide biosynthesis regulator YciM